MKSVVVLQARTGSSRLPAKVLLPIKGIPVAVLAAKRAGNTGRDVIVATSDEPSDDVLAATIRASGLQCHRGSLNDTLGRVVGALTAYGDDTMVFRLTADNVFPDGALLDEIAADYLARGLRYLSCNGMAAGLPYGMSVEVTSLEYLREANKEASTTFEREHVTPYIRRKYGDASYEKYKKLGSGLLRCTIDCLDDFLTVSEAFSNSRDPVVEPAFDLVANLQKCRAQPVISVPATRLVFGTAQLGLRYGIGNVTGQPTHHESEELLKTAITNGVHYIDTARAYGTSEKVIGAALGNGWQSRAKVITKLSPLSDCPPDAPRNVVQAFVDASVFQSCAELRTTTLDVLMLHRASHIHAWDGTVLSHLKSLRDSGRIGQLGVSVQSPEELSYALDTPELAFIQLPFNLLDWRWDAVIPKIEEVKRSRELTVQVRSALLQGLLASADEEHWRRANVAEMSSVSEWLRAAVRETRRASIGDLCISYVNSLPWVDGVAVGMENMKQLNENLAMFARETMTPQQVEYIQSSRPVLSERVLNPSFWEQKV